MNTMAMLVGYCVIAFWVILLASIALDWFMGWLQRAWTERQIRQAMIDQVIWESQHT